MPLGGSLDSFLALARGGSLRYPFPWMPSYVLPTGALRPLCAGCRMSLSQSVPNPSEQRPPTKIPIRDHAPIGSALPNLIGPCNLPVQYRARASSERHTNAIA
jgi:hypothetical protein